MMWLKKKLGIGGKDEDEQSYLYVHNKSRFISPPTPDFSWVCDHDFQLEAPASPFRGGARTSCFSSASFALTAFATCEVSSPALVRKLYPTSESFKLSCGIFEATQGITGLRACHVMPTES